MKRLPRNIRGLALILILPFLIQGCASLANSSGNSGSTKEYAQDYNSMKGLVKKVILGLNINIRDVSVEDGMTVLTVTRDAYMGNQSVQQSQGKVRIISLDSNKTQIQIENPEYHYSVPEHQKEDYQKLIFARLDESV